MKKIYLIVLMLSGCSTWSGDFDCGVGQGMKCASLSKVNKAMDRGEIDLDDEDSQDGTKNSKTEKTSTCRPVHIWIAPQKIDVYGLMPEVDQKDETSVDGSQADRSLLPLKPLTAGN